MASNKNEFNSEICGVHRNALLKDIEKNTKQVEIIKNENANDHEEIKEMIRNLSLEVQISYKNLKDKIVLSEKTTGDKIDSLNEFDNTLKGNGSPGIWESVRTTNRSVRVIIAIGLIMIVLILRGNYRGVTFDTIRSFLGIEKQEIKKVEPTPNNEEAIPKEDTSEDEGISLTKVFSIKDRIEDKEL